MVGTVRAFLNLIRKANPALFALSLPMASDPDTGRYHPFIVTFPASIFPEPFWLVPG
jgi:hypothetical protein